MNVVSCDQSTNGSICLDYLASTNATSLSFTLRGYLIDKSAQVASASSSYPVGRGYVRIDFQPPIFLADESILYINQSTSDTCRLSLDKKSRLPAYRQIVADTAVDNNTTFQVEKLNKSSNYNFLIKVGVTRVNVSQRESSYLVTDPIPKNLTSPTRWDFYDYYYDGRSGYILASLEFKGNSALDSLEIYATQNGKITIDVSFFFVVKYNKDLTTIS